MTVALGQEFTELLAFTDFKQSTTKCPFIRCSLCCTQMTASRQHIKDGVAKLVVKSDFDKLKSKGQVSELLQAEKLLSEGWVLAENHALPLDKLALPYGRFMIRICLYLLNKQNKAHDGIMFESLGDINVSYGEELLSMKTKGVLQSTSSTEDVTENEKEAAKPVSLEDGENPTNIAMDMYKVKVGCTYVLNKEPQKIWKLVEMKAATAVFSHQPLFGNEEKKEVGHSDLKKLRLWVKPLPALQDQSIVKDLQPCLSMKMEMVRAHAQYLLYCKYEEFLGQHWFHFWSKQFCASTFCFNVLVVALAVQPGWVTMTWLWTLLDMCMPILGSRRMPWCFCPLAL